MQNRNSKNAQGIDVSRYQGDINWSKVKEAGKVFAIIKASQGKSYRDPKFLANVRGARAAGVLIGAYHFLDATNEADAREEAQNLYNAMKEAGGIGLFDLPPVLDYETNPGKLSKAQISAVTKAFLVEIERLTGRKPMIYSGNSFAANFDASMACYPLWVARYSSKVPWNVPTWSEWTIWQYSSAGAVPGVNGNVDLNEYNGTLADLKFWLAGGKEEEGKTVAERDVNKVSDWAAAAWEEMKANGYFDGSRPGAAITREETAVVLNRFRSNFLELFAGNTDRITELEGHLKEIEAAAAEGGSVNN